MGGLLVMSALLGEKLLTFFGIGIHSFQVGGGLIILLLAFDMLKARRTGIKGTRAEEQEAEDNRAVAVVPLAIPMLAGPGSITKVIIGSQSAAGYPELAVHIGIIAGITVFTWAAFRLATPIGTLMGRTGLNIITRLMGLILAAIAVEIISAGIVGIFPALGQAPVM